MSDILDTTLFEAVVAGEVRSLAATGNLSGLFEGLIALLGEVLDYRWLSLLLESPAAPLLVHANPSERDAAEEAARKTLSVDPGRTATVIDDARAVSGERTIPQAVPITFGDRRIGQLAVAPARRGLSHDEKRLLSLVAAEVAAPLEMTALYEDARRLAAVDTLTGLLNRRAFLDALGRERARSERYSQPTSLLLLDVDHFKRVNDNHGHAAGDAILKGVARVLATVARRSDVVARWGGEEFVIALPQTGSAGARVAAERVRRAIAEAQYACPGTGLLRITASIGATTSESRWTNESLISAADEAMYAAKARGRNRVECSATLSKVGAGGMASVP